MIFGKKVVYEGTGESGLWHASIEKSDKTSIGPNYFLNFILEWHERRCEKNDRENNHLIHRWQKV